MTPLKIPQTNTAAYRAAAHLSKSGPLSSADLFAAVLMAERACNRPRVLQRAIDSGWPAEVLGKIDCSAVMRKHFDSLEICEPKIEPTEQKAEPRTNSAYDRPVLSKRFIPSSKGFRDDIPAFSQRDHQSFRSVPTGSAS